MDHGRALTEQELCTVQRWKTQGVLVKVDSAKVLGRTHNGAILLCCGDADHSWDVLTHIVNKLGCTERLHLQCFNGGALRVNPNVPIPKKYRIDAQLMEGIQVSRDLKKIETLFLASHAPCGMAGLCRLSIEDVLWHTIEAADIISATTGWSRKDIILLFHVHKGNGIKNTYFVEAKTKEAVYRIAA
ncbi:MAG: hypothetical protein AAB424_01775 [Patescibacteria group bacterium]